MLGEMTMIPHPLVERGVVLVNPRDFADAFTRKPTRTCYEWGQMLKASAEMACLLAKEPTDGD